jgi:hypothetical protein
MSDEVEGPLAFVPSVAADKIDVGLTGKGVGATGVESAPLA